MVEKPYVIINIVESVSTEELYQKIKVFLTQSYPDAIPVYLSGRSINSDDAKFAQWLEGALIRLYVSFIEKSILSRNSWP